SRTTACAPAVPAPDRQAAAPVRKPELPAPTATPRSSCAKRSWHHRLDRGDQLIFEIVRRDRPHAVTHDTVPIDDVGLRHAGQAELDARAAALVGADRGIGIAEIVEIAPRILRLVLPGDADHRDTIFLGDLGEQWMLGAARQAPGREEIDRHRLAL